MATFRSAPGLQAKIARMIAPRIDAVAAEVEAEAKARAPGVKRWRTMGDNRVRDPWHVEMEGQSRPDNLYFDLRSMPWDMAHRSTGPRTYLRRPRDLETYEGELATTIQCRCQIIVDPEEGMARLIGRQPAVYAGGKVRAKVYVQGPFVHEAEFGTTYPSDRHITADGVRFMGGAAAEVARRRRARR